VLRKEISMQMEEFEGIAEEEDACANPRAYGLDEDGWPNAEEFNAIMWATTTSILILHASTETP
jgi:hypothetical protein